MSPEVKALGAAISAGVGVVGAAFVVAAVARNMGQEKAAPIHAVSVAGDKKQNAPPKETGDLANTGRRIFVANCVSCHGNKAEGGFGPDLRSTLLSDMKLTSTITNGVSGKMPAYGTKLSSGKMQALVAYVRSLKK